MYFCVLVVVAFSCSLIYCSELTLTERRTLEQLKFYAELPPYRENILHSSLETFSNPKAALIVRKQLLSIMDGKKDIVEGINDGLLWLYYEVEMPEGLAPVPLSIWDEEQQRNLFHETLCGPKFLLMGATILQPPPSFFYDKPSLYVCDSSSMPAVLARSFMKDSMGNQITYRLVHVGFETEENEFIRFVLEKTDGNWELVNKTDEGPHKSYTFEEFTAAKLPHKSNFFQGFYVKESLLDAFFIYTFSDNNNAVFPVDKEKKIKKDQDSSAFKKKAKELSDKSFSYSTKDLCNSYSSLVFLILSTLPGI